MGISSPTVPGERSGRSVGFLKRTVLILGGTGEAVRVARRLASRADCDVIISLAGRTRHPTAVPGRTRSGGFGGIEALSAYLTAERVSAVVDATHPYAATISKHARLACDALRVPRVQLRRRAWSPIEGDRWTGVADLEAAPAVVAGSRISPQGCVFLSTGARDLEVFSTLREIRFLVRRVDTPPTPLPLARARVITDRGPFSLENERAIFLEHGVELLVSKNSGGTATYPKLATARALNVPVVMIDRPPPEPGPGVETAEEALHWLAQLF